MDMTATALSSLDMGACVGGSSSGMHRRQQMACDRGTSPPPLNCIGDELLSGCSNAKDMHQGGHKQLNGNMTVGLQGQQSLQAQLR